LSSTSSISSPDDSPTLQDSERLPDAPSGCVNGPTIAHCSAGIGRSGVFVSLAILLESQPFRDALSDRSFLNEFIHQLPTPSVEETIAIPGYFIPQSTAVDGWEERLSHFGIQNVVKMLREQRNSGMVQTEDQYALIYSVLRDTILDEAQKELRSNYHFTNSSALKIVMKFENHRMNQQSIANRSETHSDDDLHETKVDPHRFGSQSSPFPRRHDDRSALTTSKKRIIDWEGIEDDSSNDMEVEDGLDVSRRRKLPRTVRDSPGQEETLLNFT